MSHLDPPLTVQLERPSLGELFKAFLIVSISGFGGALPWARRMIVDQRRWMTAEEFNEAFAGVALWSAHLAGLPRDKVNVNGGAVALGHPLGASGARVVITLIHALRRAGGGIGGAALCGGGGQGDALVLEVAA